MTHGESEMDDIITFFNDFIARDLEARRAVYAEPSEAEFKRKVALVEERFDPGAGPIGFGMAWQYSDPSETGVLAQARRRKLANIQARILFLVRHYRADAGDLYRAYVDWGMADDVTSYYESYFARKADAGFTIVARQRWCLTCQGTGKDGTDVCGNCKGTGWEFGGGLKLGALGAPIETRRLVAPTDPLSLADYTKD